MSRIRTIKPSFFRDLTIGALPLGARLTYIGLWTYVDDAGRGVDDTRLIKAELWPLDDKYTATKVGQDLDELVERGRICRYQDAGHSYLHVVQWGRHQKISHPQPSAIATCTIPEHSGKLPESSRNGHGTDPERSAENIVGREGKGREEVKVPASDFNGRRPENGQTGDRKIEKRQSPANTDLDLLARLVGVCTGTKRDLVQLEAVTVLGWAKVHVDRRIIDEAIGWLEHADEKPVLPRAVAALIRQKAGDYEIQIPEFTTIGRPLE